MIKAIETRYKGYRFRSRLEARWAVFFDALGVSWDYEPEGFELKVGRYLPDFWLPEWSAWVEIKPESLTPEERAKASALADAHRPVVVLIGTPGDERIELFAHSSSNSGSGAFESAWLAPSHGHYCPVRLVMRDERLALWVDTTDSLLSKEYTPLGFTIESWRTEYNPEWSLVSAVRSLGAAYGAARAARFGFGGRS